MNSLTYFALKSKYDDTHPELSGQPFPRLGYHMQWLSTTGAGLVHVVPSVYHPGFSRYYAWDGNYPYFR